MLDTAHAVLEDLIKDLYNAEKQLLKALPKMAKASSNATLKEAFVAHAEETKVHIERLERVAELLEIKPTGKKCAGMEGLVAEGSEALEEEGQEACVDAGIIAAAQKCEHYEISAYGTVRTLAEHLALDEVVELLETTLQEEKAADEKLTQISTQEILSELGGEEGDGEREEEKVEAKPRRRAR